MSTPWRQVLVQVLKVQTGWQISECTKNGVYFQKPGDMAQYFISWDRLLTEKWSEL